MPDVYLPPSAAKGRQRRRRKPLQNKGNCEIKGDEEFEFSFSVMNDHQESTSTRTAAANKIIVKKPLKSKNPIKNKRQKTSISKSKHTVVSKESSNNDSASSSQSPSQAHQVSPKSQNLTSASLLENDALIVDNRTMDTTEGKTIADSYLRHVQHDLVRLLHSQGHALSTVACLIPDKLASRPSRASMVPSLLNSSSNDELQPMLIQPPINANNQGNSDVIQVPTRFLSCSTWRVFGDLVDKVVSQGQRNKAPIAITLLTNDVCILCDGSMEAHIAAFKDFWGRLRSLFLESKLSNIDIVLVDTQSLVEHNDEEDGEMMELDNPTQIVTKEKLSSIKFVKQLGETIAELAHNDYLIDRSREQNAVTPVKLSVSIVSNSRLGLGQVYRGMLSRVLSPTTTCISFDLPEIMDGTQCSISLDLKYRLVPPNCLQEMKDDLKALHHSKFEVVQLVPLDCVDANLLFGVSMQAQPAFLVDESQEQNTEQQSLVHVLLVKLQEQSLAILLQATMKSQDEKERGTSSSSYPRTQTFLLMAQESTGDCALEGSLFRYASAQDMLDVHRQDNFTPDAASIEAYKSYISSAFDEIRTSMVNPLVNDELHALKKMDEEKLKVTTPLLQNPEDDEEVLPEMDGCTISNCPVDEKDKCDTSEETDTDTTEVLMQPFTVNDTKASKTEQKDSKVVDSSPLAENMAWKSPARCKPSEGNIGAADIGTISNSPIVEKENCGSLEKANMSEVEMTPSPEATNDEEVSTTEGKDSKVANQSNSPPLAGTMDWKSPARIEPSEGNVGSSESDDDFGAGLFSPPRSVVGLFSQVRSDNEDSDGCTKNASTALNAKTVLKQRLFEEEGIDSSSDDDSFLPVKKRKHAAIYLKEHSDSSSTELELLLSD